MEPQAPAEERACACGKCETPACPTGYFCQWHWTLVGKKNQRLLAELYNPGQLAGPALPSSKWELTMGLVLRYLATCPGEVR